MRRATLLPLLLTACGSASPEPSCDPIECVPTITISFRRPRDPYALRVAVGPQEQELTCPGKFQAGWPQVPPYPLFIECTHEHFDVSARALAEHPLRAAWAPQGQPLPPLAQPAVKYLTNAAGHNCPGPCKIHQGFVE